MGIQAYQSSREFNTALNKACLGLGRSNTSLEDVTELLANNTKWLAEDSQVSSTLRPLINLSNKVKKLESDTAELEHRIAAIVFAKTAFSKLGEKLRDQIRALVLEKPPSTNSPIDTQTSKIKVEFSQVRNRVTQNLTEFTSDLDLGGYANISNNDVVMLTNQMPPKFCVY